MDFEQNYPVKEYKYDTPWKARARKYQSDFREKEMKVPAVPNTKNGACFGNVISAEDGAKGLVFYEPFRNEIMLDLGGKTGAVLTNVLRSEHIPYNVFFPMRHDLEKTALLLRELTGRDVKTVCDIRIEYAPEPREEYLNDRTSFDVYVEYTDSCGERCGIGIEVKYTEQGYRIGEGEKSKIADKDSTYSRVTKTSGCFNYEGMTDEAFMQNNFGDHPRGDDLRQLWRNHILGLSMMQHKDRIKDFLSVHLYPKFNEHFNPENSTILADYVSLLNGKGGKSFLPVTYEELFGLMKETGMDEIDEGWIPYLTRRYII